MKEQNRQITGADLFERINTARFSLRRLKSPDGFWEVRTKDKQDIEWLPEAERRKFDGLCDGANNRNFC